MGARLRKWWAKATRPPWAGPELSEDDLRVAPDWHQLYVDRISRSEQTLGQVSNAVFTFWSFVIHVVIYFVLWIVIDWEPFLNAISVEAVIVSLMVGVNTKLQLKGDRVAQQQRDWIQEQMEQEVRADHADIVADRELTEAIHRLTVEVHRTVVLPERARSDE